MNTVLTIANKSLKSSMSLLLFEMAHLMETGTDISKCKNCGNYFIQTGRSDAIYCEYPSPKNPERTCKEIGAQITRTEKMKKDTATRLYRNIYMRDKMLQKRHPDKKEYDTRLNQLVEGAKRWRKILKHHPRSICRLYGLGKAIRSSLRKKILRKFVIEYAT
jgi:hypothetical protein